MPGFHPLRHQQLPALARQLRFPQHAPLAMRIAVHVQLEPLTRESFATVIDHGFRAAGGQSKLLSDPALEMLFRASRGLPRMGSKILRAALRAAHDADQSFVDEHRMQEGIDAVALALGSNGGRP